MVDREILFQKRRFSKLYCKALGKVVIDAIEENTDPELAAFSFDQYTEAVSKGLELCSELATFDKDDADSIIYKYLKFEDQVKKESRNEKNLGCITNYEFEDIERNVVKKDIILDFCDIAFTYDDNHIEKKISEISETEDFCDVTLACDDKQDELKISEIKTEFFSTSFY